jgi:hypothetical protein
MSCRQIAKSIHLRRTGDSRAVPEAQCMSGLTDHGPSGHTYGSFYILVFGHEYQSLLDM